MAGRLLFWRLSIPVPPRNTGIPPELVPPRIVNLHIYDYHKKYTYNKWK